MAEMTKDQFVTAAKTFLTEKVGDEAATVDAETNLVDAGSMDSLMILEFFFFLEELKGSAIDSSKVSDESLATLSGAYELVAG